MNSFLRPPRWLLFYRNQHLIFLSPSEANWVINRLNILYQTKQSTITTTLRLLLPRTKPEQSIIANTSTLTIPPSVVSISTENLVKLFIFNGTLYFENIDEQIEYCQCLGVCPKLEQLLKTMRSRMADCCQWIRRACRTSSTFKN